MASTMVGRTTCPECGFGAAHVKQSEGEGKKPYRYCPECAAQYFPRTERQARDLMDKTRKADAPPAPAPAPKPAGGLVASLFS